MRRLLPLVFAAGCTFELRDVVPTTTGSGGSTATSTTSPGTGGSGGSTKPSVRVLGESIPDALAPSILAAYGGSAIVAAQAGGALWRVPFDGSIPTKIALVPGTTIAAVVADAGGVLWAGSLFGKPATGGSGVDGSSAWSQVLPDFTGGLVAVAAGPVDYFAIASGGGANTSTIVKLERGCTGPMCPDPALHDITPAPPPTCFQNGGSFLLVRGADDTIQRIDTSSAATVESLGTGQECALLGSHLVWNDGSLGISWCASSSMGCPPESIGSAGHSLIASDGASLYALRADTHLLVELQPPDLTDHSLTDAPISATALAVDSTAVYWIDGAGKLSALAKP